MKSHGVRHWVRNHKILTGLFVFIGLIVVLSLFSSPETNKNSSTDSGKKQVASNDESSKVKKIGEQVRDGRFEFTVNKVSCGETVVGDEYLGTKAQGQFCRVNITVRNIGDRAQTLSHSDQLAYNEQNQQYSANSEAAIYGSDQSSSTWYEDINPGNAVTGDVFFDVPKGVTPAVIELHDSAFSGGAKVSLR